MAKEGKQCSPVDPNYSSGKPADEQYLGASSPMDHPLTRSTVDANYSASGGGMKMGGSPAMKAMPDDAGTMTKDSDY